MGKYALRQPKGRTLDFQVGPSRSPSLKSRRGVRPASTPPSLLPPGQGPKISFVPQPESGMHAQRSLRWVPESRSAVQAPTHPTPWTARSKSAWRPGSWSQALGPPFVIGVRGALLRARPEASSRKLFKHRSRQTPRPPGAS